MTEFLANVIATFEGSTTETCADVFGFDSVINLSRSRTERSALSFRGQALASLALSCAAALITSMTTTVQGRTTDARTLRLFFGALVAYSR